MLFERIRELCKSHGTSIPKLEEQLNFGAGTVSKWKKSSPSADKILKVAEYFQVSTDYLLGNDCSSYYTNDEAAILAQALHDNPQFRVMFDATKDLDPDSIKKIIEFIKYQRHLEGHDD